MPATAHRSFHADHAALRDLRLRLHLSPAAVADEACYYPSDVVCFERTGELSALPAKAIRRALARLEAEAVLRDRAA